ncbi:MAG: phage portal protein [Holosporales bacterium]|jgi:HK97 family phage portal protein|nr:phage portal protein [Holosporales bacterium]
MLWTSTLRTKAYSFLRKRKKATETSVVAYDTLTPPRWTAPTYKSLANEGFRGNVIAYRCISLISRCVASVALTAKIGEVPIDAKHPLQRLLEAPNERQSRTSFIETLTSHLLLSGNSYVEATYGPEEMPIALFALRPDRISISTSASGRVSYIYEVNGKQLTLPSTGEDYEITKAQALLLHLKFFNPLDDWYGMSPLEAAARSIDQHNAVSGHNLALLQNGGRPSGCLIVKSPHGGLTEEQRTVLRTQVRENYEGKANAGKILVLEGDFEWKEMGLSLKDMDFISGKKLSAREIAQAFGVPPMFVGVPGDATFSNYKEARFHLWEDTILPILDLIVAELSGWLAPKFGQDISIGYNPDAIPALAARREAIWTRVAQATFLTCNEQRAALGYPPLPGGDELHL